MKECKFLNSINKVLLKKIAVLSLVLISIFRYSSTAQNISAFTDYRGYLQAFDNGQFKQLEYMPVKSYKFGQSAIAYIDNKNDFKIYYNGESTYQLNAADFSYQVSDYLIAYKVGSVLYVFDRGEKKLLSYYNSIVVLEDSLLAFFDDSKYTLSIYYNGKETLLENSLLDKPRSIDAGSNTLAWVNQSGFFNVFYQGRVHTLDNIAPLAYEAGRDLVAYVDDYDQYFHLFYKGDSAIVETFPPDSFKVGYGIMAYVDNLGDFRVFSNGSTRRVLADRPDFFFVKGDIIVFAYNRMFNVIYEGKEYTLENYTPKDFQLGTEGVAWIDESGRLKCFDKGKIYPVSYEIINGYNLTGSVLKYETGNNSLNIFFKGKNN